MIATAPFLWLQMIATAPFLWLQRDSSTEGSLDSSITAAGSQALTMRLAFAF